MKCSISVSVSWLRDNTFILVLRVADILALKEYNFVNILLVILMLIVINLSYWSTWRVKFSSTTFSYLSNSEVKFSYIINIYNIKSDAEHSISGQHQN